MKKLLLIIPVLLLLNSCVYNKVTDNTDIPNSVQKELKYTEADTIYIVKTDEYHYYFNQNKELIERYDVYEDNMSIPAGAFILMIFLSILFGFALGGLFD